MLFKSLNDDAFFRRTCLATVILATLILTHNLWIPHGYIIFSDLDFGINDSNYIDRIAGIFNDHFSSMNFYNISRLFFVAPLYILSLLFGKIYPDFLLRAIILSIFIISSTGMYFLCEKILIKSFGSFRFKYHYVGLIIPALYYALNPWVVFRVQHIFLLVGYAFFPWVFLYFIDLFNISDTPPPKDSAIKIWSVKIKIDSNTREDIITSVKIAFFIGLGSAAIHYFFYYLICLFLISLTIFFHNKKVRKDPLWTFKYFAKKSIIMYATILLFSAYWILTYITSIVTTNIEPQNVNVIESLGLFSKYSSFKNILYLISYWWPMFNTDLYLDRYFWICGGLFIAIIAYIIFYRFSWHFYIRLFSSAAVITFLFAMGVNNNFIADINAGLVLKVPVIGHIFRDPNKLIGPMVLFFSILIAYGVDRFLFALRAAGFSKIVQGIFVCLLIASIYLYYRPFEYIFLSGYYNGVDLRKEYQDVQSQYLPGGKIIWVPSMDNMLLSNGISNYTWNTSPVEGQIKCVGDFHLYSSEKETIFQHENNYSSISFFYSYFQYVLDRANGHYLGGILAWLGFNELGFHNDVFGQYERIKFNKTVIDSQPDLKKSYEDSIFTTYKTPDSQSDVFGINKLVFLSKGLNTLPLIMENSNKLGIDLSYTGLIWNQLRKQNTTPSDNDLLIGDNKYDFIMPQIDDRFFIYPFDYINTGNPNTGWAKTLASETEWFWTLKSNKIQEHDWNYDYGRGIAYTYSPYKLNIPSFKVAKYEGNKLIGMDQIMNNFFIPDNPDLLKLTTFPRNNPEGQALGGTLNPGSVSANLWQVAKSKKIRISGGKYIRIKAVISGVNSGKTNLKVFFYNKKGEEIKVSYLATSSEMSEFIQSPMICDAYVPEETDYMQINILCMQDQVKPIYFWIHDFSIHDISDLKVNNSLYLPIKNVSSDNSYRVFARVYKSPVGGNFLIKSDDGDVTVPLSDNKEGFRWVDAGQMTISGNVLTVVPQEGFTAINSFLLLPSSKSETIIDEATKTLKGSQADISLTRFDYNLNSENNINDMLGVITIPSSISNSLLPVNSTSIFKDIDIVKEGQYNFSINGNISSTSKVSVVFTDEQGNIQEMPVKSTNNNLLDRSLQGMHCNVKYIENKYYLNLEPDINNNWLIRNYPVGSVHLKPGRYRININVQSSAHNYASPNSLHILDYNEIIVPKDKIEDEEIIANSLVDVFELSEKTFENKKYITNTPTTSKLWIISALEQVPVKKGQIISFYAKYNSNNTKDLHAKLLWTDNNKTLINSQYLSSDRQIKNEFEVFTVAPCDGFVQPCFFMHGTEAEGSFSIEKADFYFIDDLVKIESTCLLPTMSEFAPKGEVKKLTGGLIKSSDSRYLVYNEAFNNVWNFIGNNIGRTPININLFHNGFPVIDTEKNVFGMLLINPFITITYRLGLIISLFSHVVGLILILKKEREIGKVINKEQNDEINI